MYTCNISIIIDIVIDVPCLLSSFVGGGKGIQYVHNDDYCEDKLKKLFYLYLVSNCG